MAQCRLYRDVERLKIVELESGHTGERLIGHNLALDKVAKLLEKCPRLPPSGYTGWYVVLRKKEDGSWETIGFIEDSMDGNEEQFELVMEERWDVMLPIPNLEGLPEWDGF